MSVEDEMAYHDELREQRAEIEQLRALIDGHNRECRTLCGEGDQEAVRCGYRSYFLLNGRRCSDCPMHWIIEEQP